jgi:hypothetical protein
MSSIVGIVNRADRGHRLGSRLDIGVAWHDKVDCALRLDNVVQSLLTRLANAGVQSVEHGAVVASLQVFLDVANQPVLTIPVIEDCIAFALIDDCLDVIFTGTGDCDDWVNVAVACKLDGVCTDRCASAVDYERRGLGCGVPGGRELEVAEQGDRSGIDGKGNCCGFCS